MAELRQDFSKARMNKDMDERLVPNGEYRDANNIQIATSDSSEIGTVQSLLRNISRSRIEINSTTGNYSNLYTDSGASPNVNHTVVGTVADASKDKIYYLVSGGDQYNSSNYNAVRKDYIIEYDTITETNKYVFVDIFGVDTTVSGTPASTTTFHIALGAGNSEYNIGVRVGMNITTTATTPNTTLTTDLVVTAVVYDTDGGTNKWKITTNKPHGLSDTNAITFEAKRVLNFSKFNLITGINIIDDFIYWTDNFHEPKKISISRSIAGTGGLLELNTNPTDVFTGNTDNFHTRLVKSSGDYVDTQNILNIALNDANTLPIYVDESHVTVIRKSPTQPVKLTMFRTALERVNDGVPNPTTGIALQTESQAIDQPGILEFIGNGVVGASGQTFTGADNLTFASPVDYRVGDILLITLEQNLDLDLPEADYFDIRVEVVDSPVTSADNLFTGPFTVIPLGTSTDGAFYIFPVNNAAAQPLHVKLDTKDVLFKHKFPRFSYRYKYQDGEYSTFAPFSEIAFLTDDFDYKPKKGYNFGMSNQLRGLIISDFIGNEGIMPEDVVEIDILYKETNNPTVYTVKTIKPVDAEWPDANSIVLGDRGELEIDNDLIHAVVPSNQLLRPYDNVPRKALAQEISANRLIYGNYVQNYTIEKQPIVSVTYDQKTYSELNAEYAPPSVKTLRKYQVGIVFSDEYGRETPVLSSKTSSVSLPISASITRNRLAVKLSTKDAVIPDWAKYFSYYVKEPSNEYYTMASDRWYNAEDGNVWIAFPSADRNKIQEDDTIILKKAAGSNQAVTVDNRYKVLAISNEAPDFIKTVKKSLGKISGTLGTIGNASSGTNYPIVGSNVIEISSDLFTPTFGSNLHVVTPDTLLLRVYGDGEVSDEYEVSRLVRVEDSSIYAPDGTGSYRLTITKPFGDDMAFTSTSASGLDAIGSIQIELIEAEVENKPEFDGRFFVKIYNDAVLSKYVLIDREEVLVPGLSYELRYLNNHGYSFYAPNGEFANPSYYFEAGQVEFFENLNGTVLYGSTHLTSEEFGDYSSTNGSQHPTEYAGNYAPSTQQQYFWGGGSSATSDSSPFDSGLEANIINENPLRINNRATGLFNEASVQKFWESLADKQCFWIDFATAYSWNGVDFPGQLGRPNAQWSGSSDGPASAGGGDFGSAGVSWAGATYAGNMTGVAANFASNNATPSKGIQVGEYNTSTMDIAWSTLGSASGSHTSTNHDHQDNPISHFVSEVNTEAFNFITELLTPGTRFKFARDPDAIIYTVQDFYGNDYSNTRLYLPGTTENTGAWGIRNYKPSGNTQNKREARQYDYGNIRQRWTIKFSPSIGTQGLGYNPVRGTNPDLTNDNQIVRALHHDATDHDTIQIMVPFNSADSVNDSFVENAAIWETEPRESVELDIYYQASPLIPIILDDSTNEELLPLGSTFVLPAQEATQTLAAIPETTHTITGWDGQVMTFTPALTQGYQFVADDQAVVFNKYNNYSLEARLDVTANVSMSAVTTLTVHGGITTNENDLKIPFQKHFLDWNNCWCFGNGVESDRVRDMFNEPQMDNGVKASTVLSDPSLLIEERRKHGLIWSGIYNSNAQINEFNQFIQAEPITKDINPVYGSIQRLLNRETRLIMFCEDKVLRAVTNKDALYNADGNPQLISSNAVIGDVTPYAGKYGIATNPESMAATPENTYFTDVMRGRVLVLSNSGDGIRPISAIGMKDYFADFMASYVDTAIGSYDSRKKEYNITISKKYESYQAQPHEQATVSYSEYSKGWISFKSYYPDTGISLNNKYYTFKNGLIYEHHYEQDAGTANSRNRFYDVAYNSDITPIFNGMPESVKGFNYFKYEGSDAKIPAFITLNNQNYFTGDYSVNDGLVDTDNVTDGEYYNIYTKAENLLGWYIDNVTTNLQTCGNVYFLNKEGKHYAYPTGETTNLSNLDTKEFSVQGIGMANIVHNDNTVGNKVVLTFTNNLNSAQSFGGAGVSDSGNLPQQLGINRWTVTDATYSATAGTAIGSSQSVEMTISPFYDGVYTGFPVSASNFELHGATESPAGTFTVDSDTAVFSTAGSAGAGDGLELDSAVANVVFSDNGIAGDPANTVKVTVNLNASFIPTASGTTTLDIDETVQQVARKRSSCLLVQYDNLQNANETLNAVSGITASSILNTSHVINQHNGEVDEGSSNLIAQYTFATTGTSYYSDGDQSPSVSFENLGAYAGYYEATIDQTLTNNLITQFIVKIYYTPPSGVGVGYLVQDPPDMCALGHKAIVHATVRTPHAVGDVKNITNVTFGKECNHLGGQKTIKVTGTPNSKYNLRLEKKESLTSSVKAASGAYYDFETQAFVDDITGIVGTIPSSGFVDNVIYFPVATSDTRYDIIVDGFVGSQTFTLDDRVPTVSGDATIIQRGLRTLTIQPLTQTAANFGTLPTVEIKRPFVLETNRYESVGYSTIETVATTKGVSSTRLIIEKLNPRLKVGMYAIDRSSNTSIPHNTTITEINNNSIILSNACTLPNGSVVRFISNNSFVSPFSLSVPPGTGKTFSLNSSATPTKSIIDSGVVRFIPNFATGDIQVMPSLSEYTVDQRFELVSRIQVGSVITGDNVTVSNLKVASVDVASGIITLDQSDLGARASSILTFTPENEQVNEVYVDHAVTSINDGNLKIEGYLKIPTLDANSTLNVFIDNLVNVN